MGSATGYRCPTVDSFEMNGNLLKNNNIYWLFGLAVFGQLNCWRVVVARKRPTGLSRQVKGNGAVQIGAYLLDVM